MHQEIINRLPKAEYLGELSDHPELLLELARHFGGQRIYIPDKPRPDSPITKALGIEKAKLISKLVGRGDITVPRCQQALRVERDLRIAERKRGGASNNELAREFDLHEVTCRRAAGRVESFTKRVQARAHRSGGA